ncbi:hypothetical protein [Mesorhizobium sp.]|uniref:hypothetical protein n=1 Tax=Mesorhizobium sp. TaxID=1871066 RepID=UPI000FE9E96B|nr:hypothetical protein [Mesorhizobium sp.]RWM29421.1 MAG: hypothetical protein EOR74_07010 [Mesorhizobium sp.]
MARYKPDAYEMAALRSYAKEFGRRWKESLSLDWYNARLRVAPDMSNRGSILHGLRNNPDFGPSGLWDFRFPKEG